MDDRRLHLKQIGWSEELIEICLSRTNKPEITVVQTLNIQTVLKAAEQNVSELVVNIDAPLITDGTFLHQ